jgi:ABC-type Fe3+ transport system substrate-binding protein
MKALAGLILGLTLCGAHAATVLELVAKAKQEGALSVGINPVILPETGAQLAAAFKKRFGLDIPVTVTPLADTEHFPKAAVETRAGMPPTFDAIQGSEENTIQLIGLGGVLQIEGWEALLAEVNPLVRSGKVKPQQISPPPFTGFAFEYANRIKGIVYNPKQITRDALPKRHADLMEARYRGKWLQPPYSTNWDVGILVFKELSRDAWLDTVRKAGINAGGVQLDPVAAQRVALGEFAFALLNLDQYFRIKNKDPQAPLEWSFFADYNPVTSIMFSVRKGTKRPSGATLFTLWMGTPDAKAIWQASTSELQFVWGDGGPEQRAKQYLKEAGGRTVRSLESERGIEFLKWMGTAEGRDYRTAVARAIRGK